MTNPEADLARNHSVLHVLIVEDSPPDAELIVATLKRAGFPMLFEEVDEPTAFERAIAQFNPDLVLCDHNLGTWMGFDALAALKKSGKDIPFIVVTATLGDEAAVDYIKQGAAEYVLKHRLQRLPVAVRQALRDRAHRRESARLQEQIVFAKREWELTFDGVSDPILVTDAQSVVQRANRAASELAGRKFSEIIGRKCLEVARCRDENGGRCPLESMMETGRAASRDFYQPDTGRWFECAVNPRTDADGSLKGAIIVLHEFTERRKAELTARQLAAIVESSEDAIIAKSLEGVIQSWNRAAEKLYGYTAQEAVGQPVALLAGPEDGEEMAGILEAIRKGEVVRPHESARRRKDGTLVSVSLAVSPIFDAHGEVVGASTIARDITERQRAERALRASEERYRTLAEAANDHIFIINRDGELEYINRFAANRLGRPPEDVVGKKLEALFPPEVCEAQSGLVQRVLQTRAPIYAENKSTFSGREEWLGAWLSPLSDEAGEVRSVLGIARDITERKRAEQALRESEERFRTAFMTGADAFYIATMEEGKIIEANDRFRDVFGHSREEVIGKTWVELGLYVDPAERCKIVAELRSKGDVRDMELRCQNKDGRLITVLLSVNLIRGGEEQLVLGVVRDITATRVLEQQFRQAQKMEAIGRLAGGVAHDFNNLLTIINGYAQLLLERSSDGDPRAAQLQLILNAGERATGLTRQLLAFSRKQVIAPQVLDLNSVLANLEKMLRRLIGEDIELASVPGPKLGQIKADVGQIEQVILNLTINARDAMPKGGKVTISTNNTELDENYARTHTEVSPGKYIMLAVSDSGCGMNAETVSHIFEPFFTTKEAGKGTGLGLSTVYGIVKQAGGHVSVYSEVGHGTTFRIYFPRLDQRVEKPIGESIPEVRLSGTETILVVEDEPAVRSLICETLEPQGYKVLVAGSPDEAIALADRHDGVIHLLLTDVIMPGFSGKKLAEHMLFLRPELKVLFVSGYTGEAIAHHGVLNDGVAFLSKPFTSNTLLRKVRAVVDEHIPTR